MSLPLFPGLSTLPQPPPEPPAAPPPSRLVSKILCVLALYALMAAAAGLNLAVAGQLAIPHALAEVLSFAGAPAGLALDYLIHGLRSGDWSLPAGGGVTA